MATTTFKAPSTLSLLYILLRFTATGPPHLAAAVESIAKMRLFYDRPITSRWTSDVFFQSTAPNFTHTWTRVWYCGNLRTLAVNTEANKCAADSPRVFHLLQRQTGYWDGDRVKAVFYQFDLEACENIDPTIMAALSSNRYPSIWLGMRLVKGPKSRIATATDLKCISHQVVQPKQVSVLMFDEQPLKRGEKNSGYSEKELQELKSTLDKSIAHFVALDAMYLSGTSYDRLTKYLKNVRIIVYQLEGQQVPDLGVLHDKYAHLTSIARDGRVDVMLKRHLVDRMNSYLPNVDWAQRPAAWQGTFTNPANFYEYMAEGPTLVHMQVRTRDDGYYLNDKPKSSMLSVTLERALQYVTPRRTMLFEFLEPATHYKHTKFYAYAFQNESCVLLRAVKGPNYRSSMPLVDLDKTTMAAAVTYVVGFSEQKGSRWTYGKRDETALVKAMQHPKLKHRRLGVLLSAEFLTEDRAVGGFKTLMALPNFHYLFVRAGLIGGWNPPAAKVQNLKWTVKRLNRETFIHTEWQMRQQIYRWEVIEGPEEGGTTMTTTTTGEPGVPTRTTAMFPPLTSDPPPSTTTFRWNSTRFTFPTVKETGLKAGVGNVGSRWLGVMGLVVWWWFVERG